MVTEAQESAIGIFPTASAIVRCQRMASDIIASL